MVLIGANRGRCNGGDGLRFNALKIALALAGAVLTVEAALAQSTACANLSADLAGLDRRSPVYDPYGDALTKQRAAIDRAESDYQRQCSTGFFSRPSPNCPSMAYRIQAMQANMQKLQKAAPQFAARNDSPDRQRLMGLMRQNRCGEPGSGIITTDRPPPGAITAGPAPAQAGSGRIFILPGPTGPVTYREEPGGHIISLGPASQFDTFQSGRRSNIITNIQRGEPDPDPYSDPPRDTTTADDTSGTYRTLCVRTCDGYYFPISYSASRNQFSNDADVCHARCPATETRLYAVKTPGEDGEQSFAADNGEPYIRLPNALRYRREVVNACTCGRPDPSLMPSASLPQEDRNKDGSTRVGDVRPGLPVPDARPLLGEDPETLADIEADFVPHLVEAQTTISVSTPGALRGPMTPKVVRIVGPKFYADR